MPRPLARRPRAALAAFVSALVLGALPAVALGTGSSGPLPSSTVMSGGGGGYIPVTPHRLLDTAAGVARSGRAPLGPGEVIDVAVDGDSPLPAEGVGAVVLDLTATGGGSDSSLVAWAAGSPRPVTTTLSVERRRSQSGLTVIAVGAGGTVSVANRSGRVHVAVDLVGWFPAGDGMVPVEPSRILDTRSGVGAPAARIGAGATVDLDVANRPGYPADGAEAVVLSVTSSRSSASSPVTAWPAGEKRPGTIDLFTAPGEDRTTLAVVGIGADGRISLRNGRGLTDLSVDLLGWLRDDGTYRAISGARLLGPGAKGRVVRPAPAGKGASPTTRIDLRVGHDPLDPGAPAEDVENPARVAVLAVTVTGGRSGGVTLWPADEDRPGHPSLVAGGAGGPRTALVLAELSPDGVLAIQPDGRPGRLTVDLVGWFTAPVTTAELTVPQDVVIPDPAEVAAASGSSAAGGSVTLDPGAAPVRAGEPLIIGPAAGAPEGLMGRVTGVVAGPGGVQIVTTEPMALTEIFPQGEISVDVGDQELSPADVSVEPTAEGARVTALSSGVQIGLKLTPPTSNECAVEDGGFAFDFSPLFRAKYSFKWVTRYRLGFIPVSVRPNVTMLATLGADATLELQKLGLTCDFGVEIGQVRVPIPDTPIYILFTFDGALDLKAAIDPRIEASAHAEVTVGIKDNSLYRSASVTTRLPSLSDLLASGDRSAYAMADVWLNMAAKIQGIVGPRVSIGPFLEATITDAPTRPWFALDFGLAGAVALDIDLGPFGTLTPVEWEGEIPVAGSLAACASPFGPGFGGRPCRTPAPGARPDESRRSFEPRIRLVSSGAPLAGISRYAPVDTPLTWAEANAAATANGLPGCASAHLATITSPAEQNAVQAAFGSRLQGKWLGGRQVASPGAPAAGWRWVTGEAWSYTNWQAGEPNDSDGVEDALGFGGSDLELGTWNDFPSDRRQGYLVEGEGCTVR